METSSRHGGARILVADLAGTMQQKPAKELAGNAASYV
jgi:hypothetical protein